MEERSEEEALCSGRLGLPCAHWLGAPALEHRRTERRRRTPSGGRLVRQVQVKGQWLWGGGVSWEMRSVPARGCKGHTPLTRRESWLRPRLPAEPAARQAIRGSPLPPAAPQSAAGVGARMHPGPSPLRPPTPAPGLGRLQQLGRRLQRLSSGPTPSSSSTGWVGGAPPPSRPGLWNPDAQGPGCCFTPLTASLRPHPRPFPLLPPSL